MVNFAITITNFAETTTVLKHHTPNVMDFVAPQTGKVISFNDEDAARQTVENNFKNRTDAVILEEAVEGGKLTFTYKDAHRKTIYYIKQK